MTATNALESRICAQAVSPSSHAVNQVLELGVHDMENEERKRLTKCAAWKCSRSHTGDFRKLVLALRQELAWGQALQVEALPP